MNILQQHVALHTWTLETTALADALRIARAAGYHGVELRHADFMRCRLERGDLDRIVGVGLNRVRVGEAAVRDGARGFELLRFSAFAKISSAVGGRLKGPPRRAKSS